MIQRNKLENSLMFKNYHQFAVYTLMMGKLSKWILMEFLITKLLKIMLIN
jgi:hypothetical protein